MLGLSQMKKKTAESKKISIEFDERHLSTLTTALEVYSRLRGGQIKSAFDNVFWDKNLTYEDGEVLESFVRTIVFREDKFLTENRNAYYGIGCEEMKDGDVAWEIKKVIEQYKHYQRNDGLRRICDVSGDGAMQISDVPVPKIIDSNGYWKPQKSFIIPKRYQKYIDASMKIEKYSDVWSVVDKAFKKNPLPRGKVSRIEKYDGSFYVVVEEPYKLD
jgi:hypothetical protein